MSDGLEFTDEEINIIRTLYSGSDARARREFVRDSLDLLPGEDIISIGCGPGYETAGLADAVGPDGRVLGIDNSEGMLELAEEHCTDVPNVSHEHGEADALPVEGDRFDVVVSVQVIEYVEDVATAVEELARVLKPGGRAAVYGTDWDSVVWHSSDRDRMNRVLAAWEDHCAWPHLASRLGRYFHDAGFTVDAVEPYSILNTQLTEGKYGYHLLDLITEYVEDHDAIDSEEVEKWAADLHDIDARGRTFFNQTQYLYSLHNPG